MTYCHHEKWDGTGYPQGLRGTQIPISARLMSIADVYDALTSARVYKPAMSQEKALGIMREGRGTFFAPELIDALMALRSEFHRISMQYADSESELAGKAEFAISAIGPA